MEYQWFSEVPNTWLSFQQYIWEQTLHENAECAKYAKHATFQKVISRSDAASWKPSLLSTQSNAKFVSYKPI